MDTYMTGAMIKALREARGITQQELADMIGVGSKAVSKWENARGLPDISLIKPLASALGISVPELMNGQVIVNRNVSCNMLRSKIYVCPLCGNVIHSTGEALISCCGITLPALEAEETDNDHAFTLEKVEDEYFVTVQHDMTKEHYISFLAYVNADRFQLVKLYPEGNAESRFQLRGIGYLYLYCNRHGLMKKRV